MELFKLLGTIAIDNDGANREIDETTEAAEKSESKISAAFGKIGDVAGKVGKAVATGLAAGSAAVGALAKQALDAYADYEQLVGGVETLFKDSASKVQQYADNAFKTAGLSANEYMETVTSFSASLLQSLEGDTNAAADYAQRAITDMSDNANKMGTDMSMIQNAYQGFAKQNYTMLDNLKLGYGGTQQEMFRLMQDAEKLGATFNSEFYLTTKGQLVADFADITTAIHVIQTEMGITGTTAKEADSTIQGSLASTKAAWQNLLTGFADSDQDLNVLVGNLADSATTAAKNIVPRIAQILSGISSALPQVMALVAAELPVLIEALLPGLISGAVALAGGLAKMVPSLVEMIFSDLPYALSSALYESTNPVVSAIGSLFLDVGEMWREVLLPAISGVGDALGTLWGAVQPVLAIFPVLFTETTGITSGFEIFRTACFWVESALQVVAGKIQQVATWVSTNSNKIKSVITGTVQAVQTVWASIGQPIFDMVRSAVEIVATAFSEKMPEIRDFVSQCFEDISAFWEEHLKPCFDAIKKFLTETLAPIFKEVFTVYVANVVDGAFTLIVDLWNETLKPILVGITDFLTGVFTGNWEQAFNGIKGIVEGAMNGIKNAIETAVNTAKNTINGLIEKINSVKVPEWLDNAPIIGGLFEDGHINIPTLATGGVLKKGEIGLLEGNGAEAVVPLDQNRAWISAVAKDMDSSMGGKETVNMLGKILDAINRTNDGQDELKDSFANMKIEMNSREFGRMVKAVN